ncbi:MAG: hypothetical protein EA001_13125 [Oscillatoriales cyanobacterium]|nr:MAG: hypothetical protein EA001_13125 [Oscillatoriales cyanobacterium]
MTRQPPLDLGFGQSLWTVALDSYWLVSTYHLAIAWGSPIDWVRDWIGCPVSDHWSDRLIRLPNPHL